jgi:hypothetical protein
LPGPKSRHNFIFGEDEKMGKIKLVSTRRMHVPDVTIPTEDGKGVKNRELPEIEQIKGEIRMATPEQKHGYLGSYSVTDTKKKKNGVIKSYIDFRYQTCMENNVGNVSGLEDYGITNGITLYNESGKYEGLGDIVHDFFMKVCGFHDDDNKDDDFSELKEGED